MTKNYKMPRTYGKDKKCANCGKKFRLTAPNKRFCSKKCNNIFHGKKSVDASAPSAVSAVNTPKNMQVKYDVSNGIKYLTRLAELAEKVVDNFSMLRLETYSRATQDAAIELMIHLNKFLKDQIRGGNIIEA